MFCIFTKATQIQMFKMKLIKNLYEGINFNTIPENIYKELCSHSDIRSFISRRDSDGSMNTEYGEKIKPMFMYHMLEDNSFFINQKHISYLQTDLDGGRCFDMNGVKITRENILPYYYEYGKGFNNGYSNFESNLKINDSLFSVTNEQIAHKVYSRVKRDLFKLNDGRITIGYTLGENDKMLSEISKENNIKHPLVLKKESFFKSGINGGEFYKAWEIILNNPTLFEQFFINNKTKGLEKEVIENKTKTFPFYVQIGALFAQGFITKKNFDFYYTDKEFRSCNSLSMHIKETILCTQKMVTQYINDTLSGNGTKNFYDSKTKMKNIIEYCEHENIKITEDFQSKYTELNNLHQTCTGVTT